jgi:NADH dehydrogenase FAD-containing subunit
MNAPSTARPSVVVLGGGYGGINAAKALDDVADVTLVDPTEAFVHNVAAWRTLVEPKWLDRIFLPYEPCSPTAASSAIAPSRSMGAASRWHRMMCSSRTTWCSPPARRIRSLPSSRSPTSPPREPRSGLLTRRCRPPSALIVGAGPAGLELAGEIKAFYPDKHVTLADVSEDILTGPYDQPLRDELRRQLDELVADIWFRAFGVRPHSEYLKGGSLEDRRDERGYLRVDDHLRVAGETNVFALGDVSDADRDMAGVASRQAGVVAANVRASMGGDGELTNWETLPPMIAIPLGPEGGARYLGDGVADAATIAELKGRHMLIDPYASLFDAVPSVVG